MSTGSAARIGSETVRWSSVKTTTLSRAGSTASKVAGPVTGTKLTCDLQARDTEPNARR